MKTWNSKKEGARKNKNSEQYENEKQIKGRETKRNGFKGRRERAGRDEDQKEEVEEREGGGSKERKVTLTL